LQKSIFIINGKGRAGKDTVCSFAASFCRTRNVSSITPIVEIARAAGWDGEKTKEARLLLSRLKAAFTEYNDLPFQYCIKQAQEFLSGDEQLMFIHIREPEEIERLRLTLGPVCRTLLVRRAGVSEKLLGNRSDDEVEQYSYDAVIENNGSLEELRQTVKRFLQQYVDPAFN